MKKTIVINLFGGPGTGKSTGAAYVFSMLKMHGINAELVTEFAKDKTWESNFAALNNQAYIFGKQCYRMSRCADQVDVIVTDSPLLLSSIYNNDSILGDTFDQTVLNVFNSYDNFNYVLNRVKPYSPIGRNETEEESAAITDKIVSMLKSNNIDFKYQDGCIEGYVEIFSDVFNKIEGEKMSKGAIIVDITESCGKCEFGLHQDTDINYCKCKERHFYKDDVKPDWCPIKPMPEKILYKSRHALNDEQFAAGWNACIDKIWSE